MKNYVSEPKNEEIKSNFFSSSDLTSIAVDVSGSTWGDIMKNQKEIISCIFTGTKCEKSLNSILAWDDKCTIKSLNNLDSNGCTDPSCIFSKLNPKVENLLITTDGEISKSEVDNTRQKIKSFTNLKNIICILFQEGVSSPSRLNIAVFYPFLEHTRKLNGSFYLFYYRNKSLLLLIKNIPAVLSNNGIFKNPPLEYNDKITWEDIPKNEYEDIKKIEVNCQILEEGSIFIHKSKEILNLKLLEKDVLSQKNSNDLSLVSSPEFNSFIKENIFDLIDSCGETLDSENFNRLRNIVSEWKKFLINKMKQEEEEEAKKNIDIESKNKQIELYKELMEKKLSMKKIETEEYNKIKEQLKSLSKEIFETVKAKIKNKTKNEYSTNKLISDIQSRITEEQNRLLDNEVINDFTLKNVMKVSNRVKRAVKLEPVENADNWDLSGKPVICDECLICTRDDQPMALLMIDLSLENANLLEYNVSDFSLNDEINTGTKNICAIPAGEFCVECAYAMLLMGKHPITRQKIGSVLVLADPTIKNNNKMILNAICCSIFGGRQIHASFQILLGLFDELEKREKIEKSEKRFSPKIYDWIKNLVLYNSRGNLLTEEFGTNKKLIEAMSDVVNYEFSPYDTDTWMIPLRNKTIKSMSIIVRSVVNDNKDNSFLKEIELKRKACSLMRRIFIKNIISKVITICKNKINGKNIEQYNKMCFLIENDLFNNNITAFPIINSEKMCNFENSKMIKALCWNKEEYDDIIQSIKYFEEYINNKYKNEKDFGLFTDNMITLITLGIYILINNENNINDLAKSEEDVLLGFMGEINIKSSYSEAEKKIVELNKDVFLYGNIKEIEEISKENMINIIKSISIYSKIKSNNNNHISFCCKYASHLYSPSVTKCSVCGISFVTDNEISELKNGKNIGKIVEVIKSRKYEHMQKFYNTTACFGYNESSNIFPRHKIVRIVCNQDKFKNLERPTRELILDELKYLKKMNRISRGNIYVEDLAKILLIISWDYIRRRKNLNEKEKKNIECDCLKFEDRVLEEIEKPQDEYIGKEANLDGLSENEISQLTSKINKDEYKYIN